MNGATFKSLAQLTQLKELKIQLFGFDENSLVAALAESPPSIVCHSVTWLELNFRPDGYVISDFEFRGRRFCEIFSRIFPRLRKLYLYQVSTQHRDFRVEPHLGLFGRQLSTHHIKYQQRCLLTNNGERS